MYITDNITPQNSNDKVCYLEYLFAEIVQFVSRRFEVPFLSRMFTRYIMYLFNPMFQRIWKYLMDKVSFLFIPSFFSEKLLSPNVSIDESQPAITL